MYTDTRRYILKLSVPATRVSDYVCDVCRETGASPPLFSPEPFSFVKMCPGMGHIRTKNEARSPPDPGFKKRGGGYNIFDAAMYA